MVALRREEIGVLVMELSENFWPEDLELAVLAVHDIARSRQNSLLLLVVLNSDFDTPLWDFLPQILQPGILAQNRPCRVAVLTPSPAKPKNHLDSWVVRAHQELRNTRVHAMSKRAEPISQK